MINHEYKDIYRLGCGELILFAMTAVVVVLALISMFRAAMEVSG